MTSNQPASRREFFKDHTLTHHKSHRLSYEECLAEAQKYNNVKEFRRKSWEAYSTAIFYSGWLDRIHRTVYLKRNSDDVISSGTENTNPHSYFSQPSSRKKRKRENVTLEWCLEVARAYPSYQSLRRNRKALLELCDERGWTDSIQASFGSQPPEDSWNTQEACHQEALKYSSRHDFRWKSPLAYASAVCYRWLDDICSHMPPGEYRKWDSFERCREEALRYSRRTDFATHSGVAFDTAYRYGWLDEICTHMQRKHFDCDTWEDKRNCKAEALKYSTREEFVAANRVAYYTSLKYGWLDEVCEHMEA